MLALYINTIKMRKVNSALKRAGYAAYPGDRTTARPNGCGAGYASNLIDRVAGADPDARKEVERIIENALNAVSTHGGSREDSGRPCHRFTLQIGKAVVIETSLGRFFGEVESISRDGKSVFIELVGAGSVTIEK